ncbi:hypothetical protein D9611_008605 [Ephemerocybe angulata]|uniref:MYND-type domain-containing protein n=1 Tax=Ephemerocybe angulata TaxID=980116 RepID=A0A8H5EVA8_9AGAR|nr:hypothetical protein D9611_008605 [Tulosesus angulatus]
MNISQSAVSPHSEHDARRLLANAATGELSQLKALVQTYPYRHSDLRPVDVVMPFLRVPPLSLPTRHQADTTAIDLLAILKALTCIEVIGHVGQAAGSKPLSSHAFSDILREDWPSVISWLTFSLEYSAENMSRERMIIPVTSVAQLLVDFTQRAFKSSIIRGACSRTVDLAFRIWSGEFTQGRTFTKATCALAGFFGNCLDMGDPEAATTIMEHLQDPNRAKSFFKFLIAHLVELDRTLTTGNALRIIKTHDLYIVTMESLSPSTIWKSVWGWSIKEGALNAYTRSVHTLLSSGIFLDQQGIAYMGGLIEMAERTGSGILSKIGDLSRSGLVPLLYRYLHAIPDDLPSKDTIRTFLRLTSSYLPYPSVYQAVVQSLEPYRAIILSDAPRHDACWKHFYSILRFSSLSSSARNAYYAFACDNIKHLEVQEQRQRTAGDQCLTRSTCSGCHTTFYCSKKCQEVDWKALHRSECASASDQLRVRRRNRQWFPWGSKGNLGAVLIQFFNLMRLQRNNVGPVRSVSIVDWNMGAPSEVESIPKDQYLSLCIGRHPAYLYPRVSAMVSSASLRTDLRLVEAKYRHGNEYIHVLAMLQEGHWPSGYAFLQGVGMISPLDG